MTMSDADTPTDGGAPPPGFGEWLTNAIIDYQYRTRQWFTSESQVADLFGVAPSTFIAWRRGVGVPRRDTCVMIADKLGLPTEEILAAAGYRPAGDDTLVTYQELLSYALGSTAWPPEQQQRIVDALRETTDPAFAANPIKAACDICRRRRASPLSQRAQQVAELVDVWRNRP